MEATQVSISRQTDTKMWYIHIIQTWILQYGITWKNLEDVMVSEKKPDPKRWIYDSPYMKYLE